MQAVPCLPPFPMTSFPKQRREKKKKKKEKLILFCPYTHWSMVKLLAPWPLRETESFSTCTPPRSHQLWKAIPQHSHHNYFLALFEGFISGLSHFGGGQSLGWRIVLPKNFFMFFFLSCKFTVIDITASVPFLPSKSAATWILGFHMVFLIIAETTNSHWSPSSTSVKDFCLTPGSTVHRHWHGPLQKHSSLTNMASALGEAWTK